MQEDKFHALRLLRLHEREYRAEQPDRSRARAWLLLQSSKQSAVHPDIFSEFPVCAAEDMRVRRSSCKQRYPEKKELPPNGLIIL